MIIEQHSILIQSSQILIHSIPVRIQSTLNELRLYIAINFIYSKIFSILITYVLTTGGGE